MYWKKSLEKLYIYRTPALQISFTKPQELVKSVMNLEIILRDQTEIKDSLITSYYLIQLHHFIFPSILFQKLSYTLKWGIGISLRGDLLVTVRPASSSISKSSSLIPSGNFQSKQSNRLASVSSVARIPIFIPGHPLRPAPNGW